MIGQFRAVLYYGDSNTHSNVRLESQGFNTYEEADLVLQRLLDMPQAGGRKFTGGDIETDLGDRLGWVLADEAESVQIIARRQEQPEERTPERRAEIQAALDVWSHLD